MESKDVSAKDRLGFEVCLTGNLWGGSIYRAASAGAARYEALLDLRESYPDISFADLRSRRSPSFDDRPGAFANGWSAEHAARIGDEEDAVACWNAAHCIGTPVHLRMDGGEVRETRTRSAALLSAGGQAVIWCEGVPSCYALSRVTPCDVVPASAGVP